VGPYQTGGIKVPVNIAFERHLLPILMFNQLCPELLRARRGPFADGRRSLRRLQNRPATALVRRAVAPPGAEG